MISLSSTIFRLIKVECDVSNKLKIFDVTMLSELIDVVISWKISSRQAKSIMLAVISLVAFLNQSKNLTIKCRSSEEIK